MIIPDGYAQVNHRFGGTAAPSGAEITYGVILMDEDLEPADVAEACSDAFVATLLLMVTESLILTNTHVKFGPNSTGPEADHGVSEAGDNSGSGVPPNTSILITKQTNFGGRQGRGRFFLPGAVEASVGVDGTIVNPYYSDIQSNANSFLAALEAADVPMALLRAESSPIQTVPPVTALAVSNKVATQRRRLRR